MLLEVQLPQIPGIKNLVTDFCPSASQVNAKSSSSQFGRAVSHIPFPSVSVQSKLIVTQVTASLYKRNFIELKLKTWFFLFFFCLFFTVDQVIVAPNSYIQLKFVLECVNIDIDFFWRKYELIFAALYILQITVRERSNR